jgi:predicted ATP-dependent endonuclease of OLD family
MYIAEIHIQNYRCFRDLRVEFRPDINVIIGENNSGKTALITALGLIFDRKSRRMDVYDFYQGLESFNEPPVITVSVTLRSSENDGLADKAVVATWLTKLDAPWEAKLTYQFFLPEEEKPRFEGELGSIPNEKRFWDAVKRYLPKYVSRINGGNPDAQVKAEPEALKKFDYQFLDAIRDVESELFSGTNPLLRSMLQEVLDRDLEGNQNKAALERERRDKFSGDSGALINQLIERIDHETLFYLIEETGAKDGGEPTLGGHVDENDLIAALRLFVQREGINLPANRNGLGYNNLIYISLVLSSLDFKTSVERRGQENAVVFPMLLIEEPEAHLHPALQYKLLKYVQKRIRTAKSCRQVFITTHSTHITSAAGLDPIICLSAPDELHEVQVSYPAYVFGDGDEGRKSKKYVERYLDATKSNMLFSKGVIFVEGITELLLIPCLAKYANVNSFRFLLSVGLEFQSDLEQGVLSSAFRREFETHGNSLSDNLGIVMIEEGKRWQIDDSDQARAYIVIREGEALKICSVKKLENPIEDRHVAVIGVGGVNFKHFLPIFGADLSPERQKYALRRRVACLVDADPTRKRKEKQARWKKCWPYQLDLDNQTYEYRVTSGAVNNLQEAAKGRKHILICFGAKTLEYDLAQSNHKSDVLITGTCKQEEALRDFVRNPTCENGELVRLLESSQVDDDTKTALEAIAERDKKQKAQFATYYLLCVDGVKGEQAFDLEYELRKDLDKPENERLFRLPAHIAEAIEWACRADLVGD